MTRSAHPILNRENAPSPGRFPFQLQKYGIA